MVDVHKKKWGKIKNRMNMSIQGVFHCFVTHSVIIFGIYLLCLDVFVRFLQASNTFRGDKLQATQVLRD